MNEFTTEELRLYHFAQDNYYPKSNMTDVESFRHELRWAFVKGAKWMAVKDLKG